jgi:hypothetical protein
MLNKLRKRAGFSDLEIDLNEYHEERNRRHVNGNARWVKVHCGTVVARTVYLDLTNELCYLHDVNLNLDHDRMVKEGVNGETFECRLHSADGMGLEYGLRVYLPVVGQDARPFEVEILLPHDFFDAGCLQPTIFGDAWKVNKYVSDQYFEGDESPQIIYHATGEKFVRKLSKRDKLNGFMNEHGESMEQGPKYTFKNEDPLQEIYANHFIEMKKRENPNHPGIPYVCGMETALYTERFVFLLVPFLSRPQPEYGGSSHTSGELFESKT